MPHSQERFERRREEHDAFEGVVMDVLRPLTDRDRRHMPDRRVCFGGRPCSFDVKTTIFVERAARDEYFRLKEAGEPVFIVYQDKRRGTVLADWINRLRWIGPQPPRPGSTSGDEFYALSGGRDLEAFCRAASVEVKFQ